jgi:hypothetical protein
VTTPPPDDLPRSPTGRVPKWVVDQAAGRPIEAAPFRAPTSPSPLGPPPTRRSRGLRVVAGVLVVSLIGGGVWWGLSHPAGQGVTEPVAVGGTDTPTDVSTPGGPIPGAEETARPSGLPVGGAVESPTSGFRFLEHQSDRTTPVTWSPCRPIHYVVRAANAPKGGAEILTAAVAEVAKATGLDFVADGPTSEAPSEDRQPYQPDVYGNRWAPVLVAWATKDEVPDFGVDVAGEAGPLVVGLAGGDLVDVSGRVYLDADSFRLLVKSRQGRAVAQAIVMHELGHLVGLAHVNDKKQLMFPRAQVAQVTFGAGDLAGLRALGRGPCRPTV